MIGIIGYGVVGKAIGNTLSKSYEIVPYDKYLGYDNFSQILDTDFVFISVPTPFDYKSNYVDLGAVSENLLLLHEAKYKGLVIIKSTVPPGTTKKYVEKFDLKIVFNPEFLRESTTPDEDFENQEIVVMGTSSTEHYNYVVKMYKKVLISDAKYLMVNSTEAEMIKYSQNTMLAGRVALSNMIFEACQELNLDYNVIRDIGFTPFEILGPHMTQVPGPDGKLGFGGKCLPKDINGFNSVFDSDLAACIIKYNETLRDDLHKVLLNFKK